MINWILRLICSAIALLIVTKLKIGVTVTDTFSLFEATIVIGMVNSLVRPVIGLLTLPINCLTFGIFGFLVNCVLFAATHVVVPGFQAEGLGFFCGPILMGIISGVLSQFLPDSDRDRR